MMNGSLRVLAAGLLLLSPPGLRAQQEVQPIIHGEVRAGGQTVPDVTVTLHEVSSDFSGEIDSVRVGGQGQFTLRLPRLPEHGVTAEVYFASVRYRGLLYFGPAITSPAQLDSLYIIQAYDTLAVPEGGVDLPIVQRSLFLDKVQNGWQATDVFQLNQEEDRTLFSPEEGVIWSYPLPPGARDFQVGQSELAPDDTRFTDGRMELYAPIPPGERFYLVRYSIPEDDFTLPLPGVTERLEVMVREPGPEVELPPLTPGPSVELEPGNTFRRYEGVNLQETEIQARVRAAPFEIPAAWLGVLLAGLLGGAGVFAYRRNRGSPSPTGAPGLAGDLREDLLLQIAQLDEAFQASGEESSEDRQGYEERRRELLDRLKRTS